MLWTIDHIIYSPKVNDIANLDYEVSVVLYLTDKKIVGKNNYDKTGTKEGVEVPPIWEVIKGCQINKTNRIILLHNHPPIGGHCDPSPSDLDVISTLIFNEQLQQYNIKLEDHIIVSPKGYFSFRANNML